MSSRAPGTTSFGTRHGFYSYIQHYYGAGVQGQHTKVTVPGVGRSAGAMFNSTQGIHEIFA